MKIDFSQIGKNSGAMPEASLTKSGPAARGTAGDKTAYGNIRLDISEKIPDRARVGIYDGSGKEKNAALSSVLEGVAGLDMSVQHNYFAVMSNSMSGKDFAELSDEGFEVSGMEADELVTALDRIKAVLAESGKVIEGFNDDLDSSQLEALGDGFTSEQIIKRALERNDLPVTQDNVNALDNVIRMAGNIEERSSGALTDESIFYLLDNDLLPTLDNTFQSLSSLGRMGRRVQEADIKALGTRIEEVVKEAGYEVSEETKEGASHLLERDIPLTADFFDKYMTYRSLRLPFDTKELLDKACEGIERGTGAGSLLIVQSERINLQARLVMTSRANLALMKSDHYIDMKAMEAELSQLERAEASLKAPAVEPQLFDECMETAVKMRAMPIAAVADIPALPFHTIREVALKGEQRAQAFKAAGETYEAVGTQVRGDLGDSIKKAFRNAEEILREMKLPAVNENLRAVRILGYNRMEITVENISRVREADDELTTLLDALKPGSVMKLIKDGRNPLDMDMKELTQALGEYEDSGEVRNERYARYLLKLEKNGEITQQEREGYIGIYRLFRQVEKSDGAVLGSLINSGTALTVKNLLSAVRSRKASGMDYKVDDDFGGVERLLPEGIKKIDAQIETGFSSLARYRQKSRDILKELDPGKLRGAIKAEALNMETDIPEMWDLMKGDRYSDESSRRAAREAADEEAGRIRRSLDTPEEVVKLLETSDIPVSSGAMEAAKALSEKRGDIFRQLSGLGRNLGIAKMIEDFDTKEGARAALEDLVEENLEAVENAMEEADMTSARLRGLILMSRQLTIIGRRAEHEDYEVPMEIGGELTSINLKMIRGSGESTMKALLKTDDLGEMSVCVKAVPGGVSGYMIARSREGEIFLQSRAEELKLAFEAAGEKITGELSVMRGRVNDIPADIRTPGQEDEHISDSRLYGMAKIFLDVMGRNSQI